MFYLLLFFEIILVVILVWAVAQFYNVVFRGFAPFISTNSEVINLIVNELKLEKGAKVYELGCGKAGFLRAVLNKFPEAKLTGIEYDFWPYFISKIQTSLTHKDDNINIVRGDLFKADLSGVDVVYCFLNTKMMPPLAKKIREECRPGTMIISYVFSLPGFTAEKVLKDGDSNIYFYRV